MPATVPTDTLLERSSLRLVATVPNADWSCQSAAVDVHDVTPGLERQTAPTSDSCPDGFGVALVLGFVMLLAYVALGFGVALAL